MVLLQQRNEEEDGPLLCVRWVLPPLHCPSLVTSHGAVHLHGPGWSWLVQASDQEELCRGCHSPGKAGALVLKLLWGQ